MFYSLTSGNRPGHPIALPPSGEWAGMTPDNSEFTRVRVRIEFLKDSDALVYTSGSAIRDDAKGTGYFVFSPAHLPDGQQVVINRGFVPSRSYPAKSGPQDIVGAIRWAEAPSPFVSDHDAAGDIWMVRDPTAMAKFKVWGTVDLTGIVRRNQERRQFAPENVPDKNVWFHVDVPVMRQMAGGAADPVLDSFFLEADATANPGGIPVGGQTRLDIPNDHLQYAITWFLIALAMAGVYLSYHWENGRLAVAGRTKAKT